MPSLLAQNTADYLQARRERGWAPHDLAEAVRRQGQAATVHDVARWEQGARAGGTRPLRGARAQAGGRRLEVGGC